MHPTMSSNDALYIKFRECIDNHVITWYRLNDGTQHVDVLNISTHHVEEYEVSSDMYEFMPTNARCLTFVRHENGIQYDNSHLFIYNEHSAYHYELLENSTILNAVHYCPIVDIYQDDYEITITFESYCVSIMKD